MQTSVYARQSIDCVLRKFFASVICRKLTVATSPFVSSKSENGFSVCSILNSGYIGRSFSYLHNLLFYSLKILILDVTVGRKCSVGRSNERRGRSLFETGVGSLYIALYLRVLPSGPMGHQKRIRHDCISEE